MGCVIILLCIVVALMLAPVFFTGLGIVFYVIIAMVISLIELFTGKKEDDA